MNMEIPHGCLSKRLLNLFQHRNKFIIGIEFTVTSVPMGYIDTWQHTFEFLTQSKYFIDRAELTTLPHDLGPHPDPWHPNIRPPFVCAHIEPGSSLVDILYACFEIWTWNLFATGDEGLNHAASQWSRKQERSRFPVDRRPLKRRSMQLEVTTTPGKEAA